MAQAQTRERVPVIDFEASAEEHLPGLLGAAVRMTCDQEQGCNLCCEALVQAHKNLDECRGSADFMEWLLVILTRTYVSNPQFCRNDDLHGSHGALRGTERPSADCSPTEKLRAALDSLPDESRLPVLLHDVEGLAYADIARALGIPLGSVRTRIFQGRRQLHELLGQGVPFG